VKKITVEFKCETGRMQIRS